MNTGTGNMTGNGMKKGSMNIKCEICKTTFEWTRPPGKHGTIYPTICGKPGPDGRWVPNPECRKARAAKRYREWRAKNPEKDKANQRRQTAKRKKVQPNYECRNAPIGQQWECRDCGALSANRLYCPACHHKRSENVSDQYENCIYDIESTPGNVTGLKDGNRYGEGFI